MKKVTLILCTLLFTSFSLPYISAYIDPGTGSYIVTSTWPVIVAFIGIALAFIAGLFGRFFINPIKKIWKAHKKLIITILILAIIILFIWLYIPHQHPSKEFDESLSGTHIYNLKKISKGYNLHEGKLIDNEGNIINEWNEVNIGILLENGDYLAQEYFESEKWGKYTWNDEPIWEKSLPIHHEISISPNNTILTITKETHEYKGRKVEFGIIVEFDMDGNLLSKWSTWENLAYIQQFHKSLQLDAEDDSQIDEKNWKNESIWGANYDYYHLNAVKFVPENALSGTHPAFNPGNMIISFRHGSMIFILDKDTKEILWRAIYDQVDGNLEGQHSPTILKNGNLLIFDNGRYREWSRIIELNPITLEIVWEYKSNDFYTLSQGYSQPLPNGNLLITESEDGRVFELTKNKEIVWEFYHPDRQNKTNSNIEEHYGERQWIYKMERYPKEMIDNIIKENN